LEILDFAIHLMSGATLLLFAVQFMRVGIERLYAGRIAHMMSDPGAGVGLIAKGASLGFAMQGATVVLLMSSTLVGSATIPALSAALLSLGADFGSALAVQFLQLPISALGPLIILAGGWIYLNNRPGRHAHNLGRIVLGLGLVFLSLGVIRSAVAPLQQLLGMQALITAIGTDPVNAVLAGLMLALFMHSSLAALLTGVALVAHAGFDPVSIMGFVLGCNIGSALLPLWLLRGESAASLTVPRTLAVIRIGFAVLLLAITTSLHDPLVALVQALPAQEIILFGHIGFNLSLLLLSPLALPVSTLFAGTSGEPETAHWLETDSSEVTPEVAVAAIKRQINIMLERLSRMLDNVASEEPDGKALAKDEEETNTSLSVIRGMLTQIPDFPEPAVTQVNELVDFAIRIERCADILAGKYMDIRVEEQKGVFSETPSGARDIVSLLAQLRKTLLLSQSVFWTENPNQARLLVECKQKMAHMEEESRRAHLHLVQIGDVIALTSSNQHLEMIAALKEITSKLATIGYAVLEKHGALRKSRLKSSRFNITS